MLAQKKEILILCAILALFVALHLSGLHLPYHQDEYKWPIIVNPELTEPGGIPHPPVGEAIYRHFGKIVGYDNFRIIPFAFGILNFFLLFYLVKNIFPSTSSGQVNKTALWSVFLFSISFYSLLASLMVDTDGAVMPSFFLLMAICYYRWKCQGRALTWLILAVMAAILGFLVKASFIVVIGAFVLDFLIEKQIFRDKRKLFRYSLYCLGLGIVLTLVLFLSKFIFPSFNLQSSFSYWEHFAKFGDRGWLQTFIQFSKAVLYISPLLLIPIFFVDRDIWQKTRPFFLFIFIGLFFYLFAFDFSIGALDRYFQFLIIPLCIISGAIISKFTSPGTSSRPLLAQERQRPTKLIFASILLIIFSIQFLNHFVPPLYPKTEWISRIISFKWNFLFPFTGGSGPTGFYISFLFIALCWIFCILFALASKIQKSGSFLPKGFPQKPEFLHFRATTIWVILILGILYNGIFIEEYLFGKINGSPYPLFAEAKEFIAQNKEITKVVVYNDIGGYEIQKTGKYQRRLYAAPQFEATYKDFLKDFSGHILYINIPRIGENNFYSNYFASCKNIYEQKDGYITAKILECKK